MVDNILKNIKWLGHATIMINDIDGKLIYIDPWKVKDNSLKADIILVTHSHFDHYSEDDIKKIAKESTVIYSSEDVISKTSLRTKYIIKPFEEVKIGSITVRGFPAYNKNKEFHPKKNDWLGFIIIYEGVSLYIAGDTDAVDEAKKLKVNIMILPVGGTYTMNYKEAAELVNATKPDYAIPDHFGDIVGTKDDALNFRSLVKSPTKVILK